MRAPGLRLDIKHPKGAGRAKGGGDLTKTLKENTVIKGLRMHGHTRTG